MLLDLNNKDEDKISLNQIIEYCNSNNYTYKIESLFVNNVETSLIKIEIDTNIIKNKNFPNYPKYTNLELISKKEDLSQLVLLEFLKIFYSINVLFTTTKIKNDNKYSYFFNDGITPFIIKESILNDYKNLFENIIGKKLVTTNPLIDSVLKTYPNSNISRLENYNIWYSDIRANSESTLKIMNILIDQGYFCISNIIWQYNISKISIEQAFKVYKFKQLGYDCNCFDNHFILPTCTCKYLSHLDYSSDNFYYIPIHGPLIMDQYLSEDFFQQCGLGIENQVVPLVTISLNFEPSIKTQFLAMIGFVETLCLNQSKCTNISCSDIENININENNLTLKCSNIESLSNICDYIVKSNIQLTIKSFTSLQDSIDYRLSEWNLNSKNSLLIIQTNNFIIATWDNKIKNKNKNYKKLTIDEIENLASKMENYELYYSYRGYYEIRDDNNKILLPGLLKHIPFEYKLNVSHDDIIFKIMGTQCFIYKKPSTLLKIIPIFGKDKNAILNSIIQKFQNGDYFNSWGKNYYSLTHEFSSNLFD